MADKLLHQYICGSAVDLRSRLSTLSDRELEVFRLIGEARSTRQIAEKLHLSVKTVETYQPISKTTCRFAADVNSSNMRFN